MKTIFNKTIIICLMFLISHSLFSQNKTRFPVWTFHDDSTKINGLSAGFCSTFKINDVVVNGINFELLGFGFFGPLFPQSPIRQINHEAKKKFLSDTVQIKINGINLSPSGSICDGNINGLNMNGISSKFNVTNGLNIAAYANFSNVLNGCQFAFIGNDVVFFNGIQCAFLTNSSQVESNGLQVSAINSSNKVNGVQLGIVNMAESLKGIQIGLWNKNQKRSLPFINWCFKS